MDTTALAGQHVPMIGYRRHCTIVARTYLVGHDTGPSMAWPSSGRYTCDPHQCQWIPSCDISRVTHMAWVAAGPLRAGTQAGKRCTTSTVPRSQTLPRPVGPDAPP